MDGENPRPLKDVLDSQIHVVQPGENLSMIARKYYGDENEAHWITLYNFNREVIGDNPDLLYPGMELLIPDLKNFLAD